MITSTGEAGIYIHVPFCRRRCPYCDFAIVVTRSVPREAFAEDILRELQARAHELENETVRSVYFGGGTPSLWGAAGIAAALEAITQHGGLDVSLREVTVEVNPEDMTPELARALLAAGVDRLSFGIQTFDPETLKTLGREHDRGQAIQAVEWASQAGFAEISVDLIYAVPGEPARRLEEDLAVLAGLGEAVTHVSAYELTIEPKTSFARRRDRGELTPWDEDARASTSEALRQSLAALGFAQYEVSSYARPGHEAVHNSGYWTGDGYLGLGPGAHSLRVADGAVVRQGNERGWSKWSAGAPGEREVVSPSTHVAELVFLGARTRRGVDFGALERRFGLPVVAPFRARARTWVDRGWGSWFEDKFVPSASGWALCDLMAEEAVALADEPQF